MQDRLGIGTTLAIQYAGFVSASFAARSFTVQAFVVPALTASSHRLLAAGTAVCWLGIGICLAAPDLTGLIAGFGFIQPGLLAAALVAAGAEQQGQVAGHMQSAMSAAWIAGPLVGTLAYASSIEGPLLLAATAIAIGALACWTTRRAIRRWDPSTKTPFVNVDANSN